MKLSGWVFMILSCGVIAYLTFFSYWKILKKK